MGNVCFSEFDTLQLKIVIPGMEASLSHCLSFEAMWNKVKYAT